MNQNTMLRLVIEEQIRKLTQEEQDKVNDLVGQILGISNQSDEGAIALALASVKYAEENE